MASGGLDEAKYTQHWRTFSVLDLPPASLFKYGPMSYEEKASQRLLPKYYNVTKRRSQAGSIMRGGADFTSSEIVLFNLEPWLRAKWDQLGNPMDS